MVSELCVLAFVSWLRSTPPHSFHVLATSLSESWLAFKAIWRVNYGLCQWFHPALGKDTVQTVEHLTYANMTLHRLFYEAHNNILEMEMWVMPCVAGGCKARVLGRQPPPRGEELFDYAFMLFCFPHGFLHVLFQYRLYYNLFYDILTVIEWKPSNSKGYTRRKKMKV